VRFMVNQRKVFLLHPKCHEAVHRTSDSHVLFPRKRAPNQAQIEIFALSSERIFQYFS